MSLFSKLTTELPAKLPNRFLEKGGFMPMGAVDRTARTNTAKELVDSIKAYAKESPEIVSQRCRHPYRSAVWLEYFCGAERCPQY